MKDIDNVETQPLDAQVLDTQVQEEQPDSLPTTEIDSPDQCPDNQLGLQDFDEEEDEKYQQHVPSYGQDFIELAPGEYADFLEYWNEEHGPHGDRDLGQKELQPSEAPPANSNAKLEEKEALSKKDESLGLLESDEEKVARAGVHQDTHMSFCSFTSSNVVVAYHFLLGNLLPSFSALAGPQASLQASRNPCQFSFRSCRANARD